MVPQGEIEMRPYHTLFRMRDYIRTIGRLLGAMILCWQCHAVDLYVATNGLDSNPGTMDRPFATLESGRNTLRLLRSRGSLPGGTNTIWIRQGSYFRDSSFYLSSQDSGTNGECVVYSGYPGESVRLVGGKRLVGFNTITDTNILSRLCPEAQSNVLQLELKSIGITNWLKLAARGYGYWERVLGHSELFFQKERMVLARWPNEGQWSSIADVPNSKTNLAAPSMAVMGGWDNGFYYTGDRPKQWVTYSNIWMHGFWAETWADSYNQMSSLDATQRLIKTVPPYGAEGFLRGQPFYFLNVLEELDSPGEWYLDYNSGIMYFWPPSSVEQGESVLSLVSGAIINMVNTTNITIRNLSLEATPGNAVSITGGQSNCVDTCSIRLTGNDGIYIDGGWHHQVNNCTVSDTGQGAVHVIGGDFQTLTPGNHVVQNCRLIRTSKWLLTMGARGVQVEGVGNRITHNLIHNCPSVGILLKGNDHLIEFNEVHHVCLDISDCGAIYLGRDPTYRGNVFRYNYVHNLGSTNVHWINGVYLDDNVRGGLVFGNIFVGVPNAVFIGGGSDHLVQNNVFVNCSPAIHLDARGMDPSVYWHNLLYGTCWNCLTNVPQPLYLARYPSLTNLYSYYQGGTNGIPPYNNSIAKNIFFGGNAVAAEWYARSNMLQWSNNIIGVDPMFVDPAHGNYRLQSNSPAWNQGFQSIPFGEIVTELQPPKNFKLVN